MVFLHECEMTHAMAIKWRAYRQDARSTLEAAFHDAVTVPGKARLHSSRIVRTPSRIYEMHSFIIGHASFRLATRLMTKIRLRDILIDASLHDGFPVYSRGFRDQTPQSAQI